MSRKGFNKLKGKITREYEAEGVPKAKAEYIGRATAGKVAREKRAKKKRRYK